MKLYKVLTWIFIGLAFIFFFFSLRTKENEIIYTFIALGMWGIAYLLNKFKPGEKKKEA